VSEHQRVLGRDEGDRDRQWKLRSKPRKEPSFATSLWSQRGIPWAPFDPSAVDQPRAHIPAVVEVVIHDPQPISTGQALQLDSARTHHEI